MANIFLTSSLDSVAKHLSKNIDPSAKKFLFITTASEVEKGAKKWLAFDRNSMTDLGYELEDFTVTGKTKTEVEKDLGKADGVVMAGGNTIYLLQQIQKSDSIELFQQFVKSGKVYIGSSAGSLVAGPDIYAARENKEMAKAPGIKDFNGLCLTDIVVQPHWGSDIFKDSYLNEIMAHSYVPDYKMVLLSDNQYVIVEGESVKIVDVRKD